MWNFIKYDKLKILRPIIQAHISKYNFIKLIKQIRSSTLQHLPTYCYGDKLVVGVFYTLNYEIIKC